MRAPDHADRGHGRGRGVATLVLAAVLAAACGSAPSPSDTPTPAPVVTPTPVAVDPHVTGPTTAIAVFRALEAAGMTIVANTAGTDLGGEPVKWINATFDGWPLTISEFSSAKGLAKARPWKKGAKPGQGEPPVAIRGLNILVEWGPTTGAKPPVPDDVQQIVIAQMVAALDPVFYPLQVRSTVPIVVPVHTPLPTPSPSPTTSATAAAPSPTP